MFKKFLIAIIGAGMLLSCDKSKENTVPEEGYMGSGKQKSELSNRFTGDAVKPIFHKHYSEKLTKEEAQRQWNKDVAEFKKTKEAERSCSFFVYSISVYTGHGSSATTNGEIRANSSFLVNDANTFFQTADLVGAGQSAGWDHFLFPLTPTVVLNSAKVLDNLIAMKGINGWFLKHLDVSINNNQQICFAFGKSQSLFQDFNEWFDNEDPNDWDTKFFFSFEDTGTLVFFPF